MGNLKVSADRQRSVIVVGAGVGGVATAARLSKAGYKVTVIEKNDFTGGRCSLLHHEGYRFDQGPSLLLLPEFFHETFADLDTSLEKEGVTLYKCDPNYEMHFGDGERMTLSSDLAKMKAEVEKWEGKDGFEGYLGWLQEGHRHYERSVSHVLKTNFDGLSAIFRPSFFRYILALHPFHTVYSRASVYFKSDRLRRAFTFGSMYLGMSPLDAPGTYSLLQYAEFAGGLWYPKGGFHKIVETLVNIGLRQGVEYRLSTSVTSVKLSPDHKRATGVILSDGTLLSADIVVLNADLVHSYSNLLPATPSRLSLTLNSIPHFSAKKSSLLTRENSCSSISMYWSLSSKAPGLNTHNIFISEEYAESFESIFKHKELPRDLSFYINVPSRIDSTAAPEGTDALVVLIPCGHMVEGKHMDWDAIAAKAKEEVLQTVLARTGEDLRPKIIHEIINTPPIWEKKFNLHQGSILGLSHGFFNVLSFRPTTKHPDIDSCFFVGASTHPGTGVPICLAGAKITTEQILKEEGVKAPWFTNAQYHEELMKVEGDFRKTLGMAILSLILAAFIYWTLTTGVTA